MNSFSVLVGEESKRLLRNKKMFFALGVLFLFVGIIQLSNFLQVLVLLFFKPFLKAPLSILIPFYMFFVLGPVLAITLVYDIMSTDLASGYLYFIASRVSRKSIVASRALVYFLFISVLLFLVFFGSTVYSWFTIGQAAIGIAAWAWFYLSLYSLTFISFTLLFSVTFRKSTYALFSSILFTLFLYFISLTRFELVSPFAYFTQGLLFSLSGVVTLLAFSLVFLLLAWKLFEVKGL